MQRADFERRAAGLFAVLIQVAAIAFFAIVEKPGAPTSEPGNELAYIQAIQMPELTAHSSARRSTRPTRVPRPETQGIAPDISRQADDAVVPSILQSDAPAIDWELSLRDAARRFADDQAVRETHGHTLNSRPQVLELPESTPPRRDMLVSPDGTIGVWTRDDVYCESRHRLMDHFEIWASSIPPSCRKRTQPRPKPTKEWDLP